MRDANLDRIMKNKFKDLSHQRLVDRINSRYKRGKNDDDEVYELVRRRDAGSLKFKTGYDTYELVK